MPIGRRRSFLSPHLGSFEPPDLGRRQEVTHTFQVDLGFCRHTDQPESSLIYIYRPDTNQFESVNVTSTPSFTLRGDQHGQIFRSEADCGASGENCAVVDFRFQGMHREVFIPNYGSHTKIDPMTVNAGGGSLFCKTDLCVDGTKAPGDRSKTLTSDAPGDNFVLNVLFCSDRKDAVISKSSGAASPTSSPSPEQPQSNIGAIIGGTIGGLVALILALVLAIILWRRRHQKARKHARLDHAVAYPKIFVSRPSGDVLGSTQNLMSQSEPSTPGESIKDKFWGTDLPESPHATSSSTSGSMQEKKPVSLPPSSFRGNIQEPPNPFGLPRDHVEDLVDPENHRSSILAAKRARLSDRVVQVEERSRIHSVSFKAGESPSFTVNSSTT